MMGMSKNNESGFSVVEMVLVIVIIGLIGVVGFMVYKNQHKAQTASVATTTTSKPAISTPILDPYAGWATASLKFEKLNLKYPKNWKIDNTSTVVGVTIPVSPGSDKLTLTSPNGLQVTISSGVTGIGDGPYYGKILSVNPITTLGGSYFLGFGNNSYGDTTTGTTKAGCVGTLDTNSANFPYSKYITVSGGTDKSFDVICIGYPDKSNGDTTQKTIAEFQADPSFNDAKLVVQSLAY